MYTYTLVEFLFLNPKSVTDKDQNPSLKFVIIIFHFCTLFQVNIIFEYKIQHNFTCNRKFSKGKMVRTY